MARNRFNEAAVSQPRKPFGSVSPGTLPCLEPARCFFVSSAWRAFPPLEATEASEHNGCEVLAFRLSFSEELQEFSLTD